MANCMFSVLHNDDEEEACPQQFISTSELQSSEEVDELQKYLEHPEQDNEHKFPTVARMARQFLASPASTDGVERFFSGCTQMHSDLTKKRLKDAFMEDILFAAEP